MATTNPMIGSVMARALLKLPEGERVDAHQRQNRDTERHERNVEHDRLLLGRCLLPSRVSFRSRIDRRGIRIS